MSLQGASGGPSRWTGAILLIAAVVLGLSVLLINRGPLFYYDTGSYIRQGNVALNIILPAPSTSGGAGNEYTADDDNTTSGSRSLIYGVFMAAFFRAGILSAVPLVHLGATLLSVWLVLYAARRFLDPPPGTAAMVAVLFLAASSTALPFYIAYMMPDIFAPVLLLVIAALAAFGQKMSSWELLLMFALAVLAVLVHPSHMAIGGLMIPFVAFAALFRKTSGRWRATILLVLVVLVAVTERKAFELAAETVVDKEVTYTPHITARLIADGPGMDYLNEVCPSEDVPTCALHEALSWSDDPFRLTASHIIFERTPELGSFQLMDSEDQRRVALEQRDFFIDVLLSRPLATSFAFAENIYQQLLLNSVWMTVPTDDMLENARSLARLDEDQFHLIQGGWLAADRAWIEPLNKVHGVIYAISFAAIVVLLLWPGGVPGSMKLFALFILIGIAANALVCGGISQPADRYGARVIWLLPFTAVFLALSIPRRKSRPDAGARP